MDIDKEFSKFRTIQDYEKFRKKSSNFNCIKPELIKNYENRVKEEKNVNSSNICVIEFDDGAKGYLPHYLCDKVFLLLKFDLSKNHTKKNHEFIEYFRKVIF